MNEQTVESFKKATMHATVAACLERWLIEHPEQPPYVKGKAAAMQSAARERAIWNVAEGLRLLATQE